MARLCIFDTCESIIQRRQFLESNTTSHKSGFLYLGAKNSVDNILIVLVALLCALLFAFFFNSVVRCALHWTRSRRVESPEESAAGASNTEMRRKFVVDIPSLVFGAPGSNPPGLGTDCPICLGGFTEGEKVRMLPKCNHGFHAQCIDKWLFTRPSCPTCRESLLDLTVQRGRTSNSCLDGDDRSSFGTAFVAASASSSAHP
ncbi:hypothetical protein SUGI_1177430 [Cryptomeria japonica]|uniref:RING-H2 finger protein ATL72 n=1 Tax=Cryptomeria japonica TaxID=3369 RepID=UPI002414BB4A|nr:RING-H2 finger protein ATL72 [Cryptomeria japonica]GLJ54822.1 hypothetical protein SUGI_1177430 [Cryptomeria japonica]